MAEAYPQHPPHYRVYRLPKDVIERQSRHPLLADLRLTRAGYFPRAFGHQEVRETLDEDLIIYCVAGAGWFQSRSKRYQIGPGEVIFPLSNQNRLCPDGLLHPVKNTEGL